MLPECLELVPDNSWDVVVCNSVFQYLHSYEQAQSAVEGMIRVAKRWVEFQCELRNDATHEFGVV